MADDNIHEKILAWLMTYKPLAEWYFNVNKVQSDTISVIPISGERFSTAWIDGGGECYYDFAINVFKSLGVNPHVAEKTTANENVAELFDVEQFMSWIITQDKARNYPDLGNNRSVQEIVVLQNIPSTAGADATMVKITFPSRIIYLKEGE